MGSERRALWCVTTSSHGRHGANYISLFCEIAKDNFFEPRNLKSPSNGRHSEGAEGHCGSEEGGLVLRDALADHAACSFAAACSRCCGLGQAVFPLLSIWGAPAALAWRVFFEGRVQGAEGSLCA